MRREKASIVTVRSVPGERFAQTVAAGQHKLAADEPVSFGGSDRGPGSYELLLDALGA
jgi:putative redox protein